MIELHPDTYEKLEEIFLGIVSQVAADHGADVADDALEAALGKFCKEQLDCETDKLGRVLVCVAADQTFN